jgi:hypothetical protein
MISLILSREITQENLQIDQTTVFTNSLTYC